MFKRLAQLSVVFFIAFFWLGLGEAQAATCNWAAGNSAWETDGNWSCGHAPTADDDVVIDASGVTVTINASTTVNSLTIGKEDGSVTVNFVFNYDSISNGALVVDQGDLDINTGATVSHTAGSGGNIGGKISFDVQIGQITVDGAVSAASKGYQGNSSGSNGYGPGGGIRNGDGAGGGASHSGSGGRGQNLNNPQTTSYGTAVSPTSLGSGGAGGNCGGAVGGYGGGSIKLKASELLTINGSINANGQNGNGSGYCYGSGGGSGGSIWLEAGTISGGGGISAIGGTGGNGNGGGGGGGRILLKYTTASNYNGTLTINGGGGFEAGGSGAYLTHDSNNNDLWINTSQTWNANPAMDGSNHTFRNLTIRNNSTLKLKGYYTTNSDGVGFIFNVNDLLIESGSGISANEGGYAGGNVYGNGAGPAGGTYNGGAGGGAAHGGGGGRGGSENNPQNNVYGLPNAPVNLGSGGGGGNCNNASFGGAGGGAVKIVAVNATIDGSVTAVGGKGYVNGYCWGGGGGSGGSVWIAAHTLSGNGSISVNGGAGDGGGGGGGAGRAALSYANGENNNIVVTSAGGAGNVAGGSTTLSTQGTPDYPTLSQFASNGTDPIVTGEILDETTIVLRAEMFDGDETDTLTPEFEVQPVETNFTNIATATGDSVAFAGDIVTGESTVTGLTDQVSYHWQARVCDAAGNCSPWQSYGENEDDEVDFRVFLNADPNAPASLGPTTVVSQGFTKLAAPTFQFVLSDGDQTNRVKFQFQLSTSSGFESLLVDYTSALQDQGSASFVLGQEVGGGSYAVGSDLTALSTNTTYYWRVKSFDEHEATSDWTAAPGTPAFTVDLNKPAAATAAKMKRAAADQNFITDDAVEAWTKLLSPLFAWTAAADTGGSNLKGYCLYLGTDSAGDPGTQKGLLGSSPVSATGSTCQFIVNANQIDFATTSLRGNTWLTSSKNPYYLRIRAIDHAHNLSDDTDEFTFYFDNDAPTNVKAISAASGNFSNIADMYFNWPTNETQGASDAHAGVLGFQYAFNDTSTWRGSQVDPSTGLAFIPPAYQQPFYLSAEDDEAQLEIGANVIYFRTIDLAGNISSTYSTASVNYGGEAPSFAFDASVTVTPSDNTENSFAVSWSPANPAPDRTVTKYYYMINTLPPGTLGTIKQNSAVYLSTTSTSIELSALPNVRKGANTIYVLAIDDIENYSPSNFISAEFTLNSELPDPPQNLTVADSSVKSASIWRAALAWGEPAYKGTGSLTYQIQRSTDGETWSNVSTTNGTAFVDTVESSSQYYWRVGTTDTSDDSIGSPSFANAVTLTPKGKFTDPPSLTSGPAASDLTTKRSKISWTTSRTADSKVAFGLESGSYYDEEPSNSDHVTDHVINLNNLEPGTTYYYKAKWTDEDGNTGESSEKTFKTSPAPTVQDIAVRSIGLSSAIIEFTTKDSTKAQIYYGNSTSFGGVKTISTSTIESTHTVELTELDDDTKYYFKINLFDSEDSEYDGSILDFTTMPAPRLSNVRIQQVKNTAQSTLSVSWESNTEVSSIVTYYPEGSPEYAQDEVDVKLTADQHEMLITGLLPDTPYILVVRGRDKIGNEAVSDSLKFTTATDTRPPLMSDLFVEGTSLSATPSEDNPSQLIISWTTDEPATSQVEFGEGTSDSYAQLTQQDTKLSYNHLVIIPNLAPAKVYHLRAISVDSAGNEAKSVDTVTITPKATDNALELVINSLREAFGFLGGIAQ